MTMDTQAKSAPRIHIPQPAIAKAAALFRMKYSPGELAEELDIPLSTLRDWMARGMPNHRDGHGRRWIVGTDAAQWINAIRLGRKKFGRAKLAEDEGYCMKCRSPVTMAGPITEITTGKLVRRLLAPSALQLNIGRNIRAAQVVAGSNPGVNSSPEALDEPGD